MNVRSVWSGGGTWGSGTPSGARTDAYWLPDGQTPSGRLYPDVAIGGTLRTASVQSVSWSLGISDFLADLSPNTASVSLVGQVPGTPGDDVVISTGLGVQWSGRLDNVTQTRDTAGDWWTTVTATDRIGALGAATVTDYAITGGTAVYTLQTAGERIARDAGVTIDIVDLYSGLSSNSYSGDYTGSVLAYINDLARASNAMLAMTRDGRFSAAVRQSVNPADVLALTGVNAPQSWTLLISIDVDINRWVVGGIQIGVDAADVAVFGDRPYETNPSFDGAYSSVWDSWIAFGGSQRPTASATLIVSGWSQDDLILLDPFQWVSESGTDWQVLSVSHQVSVDGVWTVSVTLDNLLDLLESSSPDL